MLSTRKQTRATRPYSLNDLLDLVDQGEITLTASFVGGGSFFGDPTGPGDPGGDPGSPGNPTAVKKSFYHQYQNLLNQCIGTVFGADATHVATQTINNAPILDATKSNQQLAQMAGQPAVAFNKPNQGPNGTVFISTEIYNSTGPNASNAIYGSYAHELGNILDARLNPPGTTGGQPYESTYGNPNEPQGDSDTGAQIEICMFGAMQGVNGPYPNVPHH